MAESTPTFEQANGLIAATFIQNLLRRGVDLSTDERVQIVENCRALTAQLVPQRRWATFDTAPRDGQPLDQPLHTIPTADRFGLVTVDIDGVTYAVTDIGMRMLTPRELASAQGFPADYQIAVPGPDGKGLSKTAQVARIGNSVCPPWAEAHVRAALYLD